MPIASRKLGSVLTSRLSALYLAKPWTPSSIHSLGSVVRRVHFHSSHTALSDQVPKPYRFSDHTIPTFPPIEENAFGVGTELQGESGQKYTIYDAVCIDRRDNYCHVWAASAANNGGEVIIKVPSGGSDRFKKEVETHDLFPDSIHIRQKLDVVPPTELMPVPLLVLQPFETSLLFARHHRPIQTDEIKWIMKKILLGLSEIHHKGLVHTDLSMRNVYVSGFGKAAGPVSNMNVALAISPLWTAPGHAIATSLDSLQSYHAPEVLFDYPISSATDIWSWGIILCHLLESQHQHRHGGLYDNMCDRVTIDTTNADALRYALTRDFDLNRGAYFEHGRVSHEFNPKFDVRYKPWQKILRAKGLKEEDIVFLSEVLVPNPEERPSIEDILLSGYLDQTPAACAHVSRGHAWIPLPHLRQVSQRQYWPDLGSHMPGHPEMRRPN